MTLANCARCGDVFSRDRYEICPQCRKQENEEVDRLKRFIQDHPDATLVEIVTGAGVSKSRIEEYVRANRLLSVDAPSISLTCEECGAKIDTGRFCKKCMDNLRTRFSASASQIMSRKTQ